MRERMEELLELLRLPREHEGFWYLSEAAEIYRRTGLDGAALLAETADACGTGFTEANRGIAGAVGYIQNQPEGARLLRERSVMGAVRWMLELCLRAERAAGRENALSMSQRLRILLDKSNAPC